MKIGIFGGSFNPPHKMHVNMAQQLINKHYVDKIIYVPTGSKYKYKNNLIADEYRYKMLDIICKKNKNMEVSNYELKDKVVHTYQTLDYFRNKYSKDEIYFICGTDNLTYMDKWENGTDILSYNKILVIKRETDDYEDILNRLWEYKDNIILTDIKPYKISSTIIRDMINKGDSNIDNYLDKDVIAYIKENKLYND
ncbi:MAG TPA: nicotinate (nicotinamide) nucleotide adenylyltransferase [Candidatus Coprovivens excrementavium]|nr:nicotinate (nicotinamide) nucleotide adenylyltransferase [Candidatus Coprovivens excrementavium]